MKTFFTLLSFASLCSFATQAQYCMLPGRTSYSNNQPGIKNFKLNTIDRTSSNVENALSAPPVVITNDTTQLKRGQTYSVSIMHNEDPVYFPGARNNVRVWIDYNADLDFIDAGETVVSKDFEAAGTTTATFTVPANAPLGFTKLRATAKMSSDAGHTIPTPCDEPADPIDYHGEMEDYVVKIVSTTGINDAVANTLDVSVYPNPTSGLTAVVLNNTVGNSDVFLSLYDVTGKKVADLPGTLTSSDNYVFDINGYVSSAGVYFIKLTSADGGAYQKLVKVN